MPEAYLFNRLTKPIDLPIWTREGRPSPAPAMPWVRSHPARLRPGSSLRAPFEREAFKLRELLPWNGASDASAGGNDNDRVVRVSTLSASKDASSFCRRGSGRPTVSSLSL